MTIIFWITLRFVKRDRKESNQKRHQMEHSQSFSSWQSVCDHWSGTFWWRRRRRNGRREKEKSEEVYFYQHWKYEGRKGGGVSGVSKPEILRNSCKRVTRKHWTDWTDRGTSAEKNHPTHKESQETGILTCKCEETTKNHWISEENSHCKREALTSPRGSNFQRGNRRQI